jgi:hypothetical protein
MMTLAPLLAVGLTLATTSVADPGIGVGEKAPAFALRDQNGEAHALADLLGDEILALLFFRSADW